MIINNKNFKYPLLALALLAVGIFTYLNDKTDSMDQGTVYPEIRQKSQKQSIDKKGPSLTSQVQAGSQSLNAPEAVGGNTVNRAVTHLDVEGVSMIEGEELIEEGVQMDPVVNENLEANSVMNEGDLPDDIVSAIDKQSLVISKDGGEALANNPNIKIKR